MVTLPVAIIYPKCYNFFTISLQYFEDEGFCGGCVIYNNNLQACPVSFDPHLCMRIEDKKMHPGMTRSCTTIYPNGLTLIIHKTAIRNATNSTNSMIWLLTILRKS